MSNDIAKQYTPYIGPDTLRALTHLMKNHFDSYTNKHTGYEDINGCKYNGTVDNYGSEILLESRKLMMHKPPLQNIIIDDTMSYYFNIQYSELINSYDQQYMLIGILNKDVLLSSNTYHLQFEDCDEQNILRAESISDPNVYRSHFIHTNTPPKLIITNSEGETSSIDLIINDTSGEDTDYYFYINSTTSLFIDSFEDGVLTTIDISNNMFDLPFIWICLNTFRLYPELDIDNNVDYSGKPLLTIGTDGNDISRLYPYINGITNIPTDEELNGEWYIKAYPKNDTFITSGISMNDNYIMQIGKIQFVNYADGIHSEILYTHEIEYDDTFVNLYLSKDVEWSYNRAIYGDDDYDGTTYINPTYAYVRLNDFINNIEDDVVLTSVFVAKFDSTYKHIYSELCNNAVSGIHIDSSTDYVGNGVVEKFGSTHHLGDFDGLPSYFKYELPRNISRNHVDLYTIRDKTNINEIHIEKKQCCGLIVDSALPQNSIQPLIDSLPINIVYDMTNHKYITQGKILSPLNVLSQITYVNDNKFSNIRLYPFRRKFIYHGNNFFSLNMVKFDPELETGRVYYLSNDSIEYENNELLDENNKKPPRTLARICDIPTSFIQLSNIYNYSPTILPDWNSDKSIPYVRSFASYTVEDCNNILNNGVYQSLILKRNNRNVFNYDEDLLGILHSSGVKYKTINNINESLDLSTPLISTYYSYTPINSEDTSGYVVGDTFKFNIGGVYFDGTVTGVDNDQVTSIEIEGNIHAIKINIHNLNDRINDYHTTTITGNGQNLIVRLTIDSDYWDEKKPTTGDYHHNIYAFKFDEHDHIWLHQYHLPTDSFVPIIQMTGPKFYDNSYDNILTQSSRTIASTMLNNYLNINKSYEGVNIIETSYVTQLPTYITLGNEDRSDLLTDVNIQNGYYMICKPPHSGDNYIINCKYKILNSHFNDNNIYDIFPRYNRINIDKYYPIDTLVFKNQYNQPTISFYNPLKTYTDDKTNYTSNICKINKHVDITFHDYFGDEYMTFTNDNVGYLNENVYRFNNYQSTNNRKEYYNQINELSREELIDKIITTYPNAELLSYESTEYAYSREMLIDYLMINYFENPIYKIDNTSLLRTNDEPVLIRHNLGNGKYSYTPTGEQPTGDIVELITSINPNIKMNGIQNIGDILFVFKLDKQDLIVSLNDFKIYDDDNNDVSQYSLLIYDNSLYVYLNNSWTPISR